MFAGRNRHFGSQRPVSLLLLCLVTALLFIHESTQAQRLPSMDKSPWYGFFSGYKQRDFELGVDDEGKLWIYLIDEHTKKRIGSTRWIKTYIEIGVITPKGKRVSKWLKDDEGFETELEEGLDHKEVTFTAMTTGNAKVEINIKYTRKGAILDGRILDPGELADEGELFFRFKVSVPAMYSPTYNDDDEKSKLRMGKDSIRLVRAKDKKKVKLTSYKDVDLASEENAKDGILEALVEMDGMEGKELYFTTEDKKGVFYIENSKRGEKGKLWKGYRVIWERKLGSDQAKGGIHPFVIEIK